MSRNSKKQIIVILIIEKCVLNMLLLSKFNIHQLLSRDAITIDEY